MKSLALKLSLPLLVIALVLIGLMPTSPTPHSPAAAQNPTIRVAVIPVLDTLPLFIAQEQGYFAEEGLNVEFIPVASPIERDQLIITGEADAMITDLPGVALFNEVQTLVQVVYISRLPQADGPIFRILAAPNSPLVTPADLSGVPIGVSEGTVIEYLTDRLLESAGVTDIRNEVVPAIPLRFELLMQGQLRAAMLPDPLAQAAIESGAVLIIDDTVFVPDPETAAPDTQSISQSVVVFIKPFIDRNPEAVAAFLRAWDRAVVDLNADPEVYRALFLEQVPVPESIQDTYVIPPFPRGQITTEAVWDDYIAWLLDREIIEDAPAYSDSINPALMPLIPLEEAPAPQGTPEPN